MPHCIARGSTNGWRQTGIHGRTVHGFFEPLRAGIREVLGESAARFLAEPVFDEGPGEVLWYADHPAVAIDTLPEEQRSLGEQRFRERMDALCGLSARWIASDDAHLALMGQVLGLVLSQPLPRHMYIADEEPVFVWWGMAPEPASPHAERLFIETEPAAVRKQARPAEPPRPADGMFADAPPYAEVVGARVFWGVVAASVLLAVISIASGGVAEAVRIGDVIFGLERATEASAAETELRRRIAAATREETVLRERIAERAHDAVEPCPPPSPPAASAPLPAGAPLQLPPEERAAGNVRRLAGVWRSTSGLTNMDGKPVSVRLVLDAEGRGTSEVHEDPEGVCHGPLRARFEGSERLVFEDLDDLTCPSGTKYRRSVITCRFDADDRAVCVGSYDEMRFNVMIRRDN